MRHFIKIVLFKVILFVLLINCLPVTINATIISEKQQISENFLFCKMGDADFDKNVTAADARAVLRVAVGLHSLSPEIYIYCDCNYDGSIDAADTRIILRTAVGLENQQEHSFEFSELTPANCTDFGSYMAKCIDCGIVVNGEIPTTEHIFDSGRFINEPTANEKATKVFTCAVCGYIKNTEISYCEYFGHKWNILSLQNIPVCEICNFSDDDYMLSQAEFSEILVNLTNADEITNNLTSISDKCGSRWYSKDSNNKASEYIMNKLCDYGFDGNSLVNDKFYVDGIELKNIYAKIPTAVNNPDIIVLCAHYDSSKEGKGAIDNATGVSSLLELARIMNSTRADFGCEIRFCFLNGEEIGYYGAYRYCWYISQSTENSPASIERHKYILNLDMTGKPKSAKDYYLCVSTEPVTDTYQYRKAENNPTSDALTTAKAIIGDCTEAAFYCPVSAGKHDLLPFRKYGLDGATLSWREKTDFDNNCDYNLIPPTIIHSDYDSVENTDILSLCKTTLLINYTVAIILYDYSLG